MSTHKHNENLVPVKSLVLRCLMEKQDNDTWFSICLDLNVHAQGETPARAKTNLHDVIRQYVEEAVTEDYAHIGDLIPRYAPAYFWVRYYWARLFSLYSRSPNGKEPKNFQECLPLVPVS